MTTREEEEAGEETWTEPLLRLRGANPLLLRGVAQASSSLTSTKDSGRRSPICPISG